MSTENQLIAALVDAQRRGAQDVDAAPYSALGWDAAYRVQHGVMQALGESMGLYKTATAADGTGIVAPIFASRVGQSGVLKLPLANITGLEVEVAVVLGADIAAGASEADVAAAVDHYFVGIEVVGTRYADRSMSGPTGGLADGLSAYGYVINPARRPAGTRLDGFDVTLEFGGKQIYQAPAKHGFGSVLGSLVAYARAPRAEYPLRKGMMITTGSLCGMVPTSGTGHAIARLGDSVVEFDIV